MPIRYNNHISCGPHYQYPTKCRRSFSQLRNLHRCTFDKDYNRLPAPSLDRPYCQKRHFHNASCKTYGDYLRSIEEHGQSNLQRPRLESVKEEDGADHRSVERGDASVSCGPWDQDPTKCRRHHGVCTRDACFFHKPVKNSDSSDFLPQHQSRISGERVKKFGRRCGP